MNEPLHILNIIPTSPLPIFSGGRQRMFQILRRLAPRHHITVLSFWRDEEARQGLRDLAAQLPLDVIPVPFTRLRLHPALPGHLARRLWGELRGRPADLAVWWQPAMQRTVQRLLEQQTFDLIQVEWPYLAPYALAAPQVPNLLITHDIFSVAMTRRSQLARGRRRRQLQRQARRWAAYEQTLFGQCDLVAAMSENDAAIIRQRNAYARMVILPNGVDTSAIQPHPPRPQVQEILFVGSPTHDPNIDAACWLLQEIWPAIHHKHPSLHLTLLNLDHPRIRACLQAGVTLLGRQPDVQPYYDQADVMLVPLRAGSGTRLKLLEAFAAGLPVISTSLGYEGLPVTPGKHLLQAESPADFIQALQQLLDDRPLRARLGAHARQLVEQKYDWAQIARQYEIAYQRLLTYHSSS